MTSLQTVGLPNEIFNILHMLNDAGFEAYVVGGAVRDHLLGRAHSDFDIATAARPDDIHALFENCADTGAKHGTVTVFCNPYAVEITTFRVDGPYIGHRRPAQVSFSDSLLADLARRDFTINAMAYHPRTGIVDLFGGKEDLKNGVIRTVGNPNVRFLEDALRMLRAVRFCCTLGFCLAPDTKDAITENSTLIQFVSAERIFAEFHKMLLAPYVERMADAADTGIFEAVAPGLSRAVYTGVPDLVKRVKGGSHVKWAAFLHGMDAQAFLSDYKASNKDRRRILALQRLLDTPLWAKDASDTLLVKQCLKCLPEESLFDDLIELKCAFGLLSKSDADMVRAARGTVWREQQPYLLRHLAVSGRDLIKLGIRGASIGKTLDRMLEMVTEHPKMNQADILLNWIGGQI